MGATIRLEDLVRLQQRMIELIALGPDAHATIESLCRLVEGSCPARSARSCAWTRARAR